jgi:exosortase
MQAPVTASSPSVEEFPGFADELRAFWRRLPNKALFFPLLGAWLLLFAYLGNSTFGYTNTPSLLVWMYKAYVSESAIADDAHGLVIPFLVLGLCWWKRRELLAAVQESWWPGLLILAGGLVFHILGYLMQQPRISIVGLFVGIYGLTGLTWGWRWMRASFFPFFLFVFMMPLGSATEPVTFPLRLFVTKMVAVICNVLGVSVINEGTQLFNGLRTYQYEVAPACGGIKSLVTVGITSIVCAHVFFQRTRYRLLLIAAALPLAVIGNTVRLLVIIFAAEIGGQRGGNAAHDSGFWSMVPYIPAFLGLALLIRWLERKEGNHKPKPAEAPVT